MRFMRIASQIALFAVIAAGSAFGATCTNASLNGVFGFLSTGFDSSPLVPGTSVGQYTFDGQGNVSGSFIHSADGTITQKITFSGTYSVSKNCMGSMTFTKSGGGTEDHNFTIDDSKKGMQLIFADSGHVRTGAALAQGSATCGFSGKKQTFAVNLIGTDNGVGGPVAYVGQIVLDGKGTILSGTLTASQNGTITSGIPVSGTYTEKSDCTGTEQVVLPGSTANLYFVIVDGGKEALLIQTDNGTTVSGTAQQ